MSGEEKETSPNLKSQCVVCNALGNWLLKDNTSFAENKVIGQFYFSNATRNK